MRRYTRIKKYRRNRYKSIVVAFQITLIWYGLIILGVYITSDTGARFNDIETIENHLHVKWDVPDNDEWDKSSLDFDGTTAGGTCERIYTEITNAGDRENSVSTWRYYLYEVDSNGNFIGIPVDTGVVPTIKSGETGEISSTSIEVNKSYRFIIRRPLGHPAKNNPDENGYTYIKSDNILFVQSCGSDTQLITTSEQDNDTNNENKSNEKNKGKDKGKDKQNNKDKKNNSKEPDKESSKVKQGVKDQDDVIDQESKDNKSNITTGPIQQSKDTIDGEQNEEQNGNADLSDMDDKTNLTDSESDNKQNEQVVDESGNEEEIENTTSKENSE